MIKNKPIRLTSLILLGLLLTACQSLASPSTLNTSVAPFSSPLMLPTAADSNSPVATPALVGSDLQPVEGSVPTPSKHDRSTITGFLMTNKESPTPALGVFLYLATIHTDKTGKPLAASFDRQTAPRAQTDAAGRFVFVDVPSQQYALILDRISETFLLNSPSDNGDMLLTPEAGEILDVGRLVYSSLPDAGPLP
jgi:hypothetical protein